jgi:ribosome-associated toxin RatA of RatAB toxin-antitoxin module
MPEAIRSVEVDVPPEFFFTVVTDFERYPEFVTTMKGVRVLRRGTDDLDVEFQLELIKSIRYTLRLKTAPPSRVEWTLLQGDLMKENTGGWTLTPGGRDGTTRATYRVNLALKGLVPRYITNKLVEVQLPEMLEQFKRRAETQHRDRAGAA